MGRVHIASVFKRTKSSIHYAGANWEIETLNSGGIILESDL